MSVHVDPSGRRSIQVEVEVPGTPEQVWQAIATGPGITCWFAPTELDEHVGGDIRFQIGAEMESASTVSAWEPPRRLAAEGKNWAPDPNAPPIATEWIVEARAGGTCVVRVVHSLFASTDDWDDQLESVESGWPDFFAILRLYLTHFAGQNCTPLRVMGTAPGPKAGVWNTVTTALGLAGAEQGQRWSAAAAGEPRHRRADRQHHASARPAATRRPGAGCRPHRRLQSGRPDVRLDQLLSLRRNRTWGRRPRRAAVAGVDPGALADSDLISWVACSVASH